MVLYAMIIIVGNVVLCTCTHLGDAQWTEGGLALSLDDTTLIPVGLSMPDDIYFQLWGALCSL